MKSCGLLVCVASAALGADDSSIIFPRGLAPGDTIAIVAPAGDLERDRIERAAGRLREMGFRVTMRDDIYRRRGYLAGSDEQRSEELMDAFRDPKVNAIFCGAGGFGTTRILDALDYHAIRANPKILTGFSDITGLHLAIQRKAGLVTFHGPVASYGLGTKESTGSTFSLDYFWRAILLSRYPQGASAEVGYTYTPPQDNPEIETIAGGVAQGRLTGGNLTLVAATMGTPYEIETDDRILFLEDRNEDPYRIDRMLSQMRLAGKLDHLAGVVLGVFVDCDTKTPAKSLTLEEVFRDYFEDLGVPVIWNFPCGHFKYNATMPLGVRAELNADTKTVRLLENPVRPALTRESIEQPTAAVAGAPNPSADPTGDPTQDRPAPRAKVRAGGALRPLTTVPTSFPDDVESEMRAP